jgi:hypothetical protein
MKTLLLLIIAHYVGDFGLQNDFIAKFKVPHSAPFWFHVMIAHCAIHAGGVYVVSHNIYLAALEFIAHFLTDYLKCLQKLTFNQDQALHIMFKVLWCAILFSMGVNL